MDKKSLFSAFFVIVIGCMVAVVHADDVKVNAAMAQDERGIALNMAVYEEVEEINMMGNKITRRVDATSVVPGDRLVYVTTVSNRGKELAENVAIVNPIPQHTTYLEGSAEGKDAVVAFSVDGGKTFDLPENLMVRDANNKPRTATSKDYTHIRWILSSLPSKTEGVVMFRARLN